MSARILVVDDIEMNRKVLEAKLAADYYQVLVAGDGASAIEIARCDSPDIVLLDVMMPGIDGYETCRRLKDDEMTRHIPVLMVTALGERESRIRALESGADDYLTKPIDDSQLMARIRNLAKLKPIIDELRMREATGRRMGLMPEPAPPPHGEHARVLLIDDDERQIQRMWRTLEQSHYVARIGQAANGQASAAKPDVMIVSLAAQHFDGLKVIAHIRSQEPSRRLAVVALAEAGDNHRAVRALDLGADDIIYRPVDPGELAARVRTLVKRKRYIDQMSDALDRGLEAAVIDSLTGLHNRRYLDAKLEPLIRRVGAGRAGLAVLVCDLDHFKALNDLHGHDAGDAALREFARRLSTTVRPLDLVCRTGGEEFVVVMPGTSADLAALAAERLRRRIVSTPYQIAPGISVPVTVSIGVAAFDQGSGGVIGPGGDEALYRAKQAGRNRVMTEETAAGAPLEQV
jgi:two-component system cell cycle response regulator